MGPFLPSFGFTYILILVDYVSTWVEAIATRPDDAKTTVKHVNLSFCINTELLRQSSVIGEHIFVVEP